MYKLKSALGRLVLLLVIFLIFSSLVALSSCSKEAKNIFDEMLFDMGKCYKNVSDKSSVGSAKDGDYGLSFHRHSSKHKATESIQTEIFKNDVGDFHIVFEWIDYYLVDENGKCIKVVYEASYVPDNTNLIIMKPSFYIASIEENNKQLVESLKFNECEFSKVRNMLANKDVSAESIEDYRNFFIQFFVDIFLQNYQDSKYSSDCLGSYTKSILE
jgi:hypothetical protein